MAAKQKEEKQGQGAITVSPPGLMKAEHPAVIKVADVLCRMFGQKTRIVPPETDRIQAFYSLNIPDISISRYLQRFVDYMNISFPGTVVATIYLRRFRSAYMNAFSLHRMLATALLLALKYTEDISPAFKNEHFARTAGIPTAELNNLELEMLFNLEFNLYIGCGFPDENDDFNTTKKLLLG